MDDETKKGTPNAQSKPHRDDTDVARSEMEMAREEETVEPQPLKSRREETEEQPELIGADGIPASGEAVFEEDKVPFYGRNQQKR